MFKYSSVKFSVFEKAQELDGFAPLKILKCAKTKWILNGKRRPLHCLSFMVHLKPQFSMGF